MDVFSPDYSAQPLFREAVCYEGVVAPGEFIFYPSGWWHSTQTLDTPTVSLSSLVVDEPSHQGVIAAIAKDCQPRPPLTGAVEERPPNYPPALCTRLERCLDRLRDTFQGTDTTFR